MYIYIYLYVVILKKIYIYVQKPAVHIALGDPPRPQPHRCLKLKNHARKKEKTAARTSIVLQCIIRGNQTPLTTRSIAGPGAESNLVLALSANQAQPHHEQVC